MISADSPVPVQTFEHSHVKRWLMLCCARMERAKVQEKPFSHFLGGAVVFKCSRGTDESILRAFRWIRSESTRLCYFNPFNVLIKVACKSR